MALNELLTTFETEANDVVAAKTALDAAKVAATAAQVAVVDAQGTVNVQADEARAAYMSLLAALDAIAKDLGLI